MKGLASLRPRKLSRKALLQAALSDRGISQAEIARDAGVSEATVSRVIAGTHRHETVELVTCEKLGVSRQDLFPPRESAAAPVTEESAA